MSTSPARIHPLPRGVRRLLAAPLLAATVVLAAFAAGGDSLGLGAASRNGGAAASTAPGTVPDGLASVEAEAVFGRLPLHFEANRGQTDEAVEFLARGRGYTLFLTQSEAVLSLRASAPMPRSEGGAIGFSSPESDIALAPAAQQRAFRWRLAGADGGARAQGLDELPGRANYFVGSDRERWRTGIPTFARVRYESVYPGIDLVYYGNQGSLEYDFVVRPGADPGTVRLAFDGAAGAAPATAARLDAGGDLVWPVDAGDVRFRKPRIYQEMGGVRRKVEGAYTLAWDAASGTTYVGFQVGAYDVGRPLIIDPVLDYSTYLGGTGLDRAIGMTIGPDGSLYVTGQSASAATFPSPQGGAPTQVGPGGDPDAFVVKLNAAGSAIAYVTFVGGADIDTAAAVTLDELGGLHVVGVTTSGDFPWTADAFDIQHNGGVIDAFLSTLGPDGALAYSTFLGGTRHEVATGVASRITLTGLGPQADVYISGFTSSEDFPTKQGFQDTALGGFGIGGLFPPEAFVVRLTPSSEPANDPCVIGAKTFNDCGDLLYATYLGGSSIDFARDIVLDQSSGRVFVTGQTCSANFPATAKAFSKALHGVCDAFVARVDTGSTGDALLGYATFVGGSGDDDGRGIALLDGVEVFVAGETDSPDFPIKGGPLQTSLAGATDAFVVRLAADGINTNAACTIALLAYNDCADLRYATYLGGGGSEVGSRIAVDAAAAATVTGQSCSPDFPVVDPLAQSQALGINVGAGCDAFVSRLKFDGSALTFSTYLGGSGSDLGAGVLIDDAGSAYVSGVTASGDFPTVAAVQAMAGGANDAFVARISAPCVAGAGPLAYLGDGSVIDTEHDCLLPYKVPGGLLINIGETGPGAVAVSPDGATVYGLENGPDLFDTPNYVLVYDTAASVISKVFIGFHLGLGLRSLALSPDGSRLFVAFHEDDGTTSETSHVYVVDTATKTVTDAIGVITPEGANQRNLDGVAMHPDGTRAYVSLFETHEVVVIDTQTNTPDQTGIPTVDQSRPIVVTPDGQWVYVGNNPPGDLAVINTVTKQRVDFGMGANLQIGGTPTGLAVTPDGTKLYVAAGVIVVIDVATQSVLVPFIPLAAGSAIAITPDGTKAYVTGKGPYVQVIDVATDKVVNVIAGAGGDAVAIGPQDRDGDGLSDQIDGTVDAANAFTHLADFSDDFTDRHRGGAASGRIVSRDGLKVSVWDAFNPAGFYANARGGAGAAEIRACGLLADQSDGAPVFLTEADVVKTICGSVTVEVIHGPVEVGLGPSASVSVPTGGTATVTEPSPGEFRLDNRGGSAVTVLDAAGEVLATVLPGESFTIDATAPVTTAGLDPAPNGAGWNHTDVTVTLAATDQGSGVREVHHRVNGGPEVVTDGASAVFALTAEGVHSVEYFAVDNAGNAGAVEALTARIDRTAPEAVATFDPVTGDVAVHGRDALSGVPDGGAVPGGAVPQQGGAELRTYRLVDAAGNALVVVAEVRRHGQSLTLVLVSLRYGEGAAMPVPDNSARFEWSADREGALKTLEQKVSVGKGKEKQDVSAQFDVRGSETTVKAEGVGRDAKRVVPGLALLRLVSLRGQLTVEY